MFVETSGAHIDSLFMQYKRCMLSMERGIQVTTLIVFPSLLSPQTRKDGHLMTIWLRLRFWD